MFAALAVYLLLRHPLLLLAVEAVFIISLAYGAKLVGSFFGPLELIRTGAELIRERDFTSRFREVGQPEMNQLIGIYNRMIDHLREERTKLQEQHYFFDKVLKASPVGVVTLDFDERIAMLNPSAEHLLQTTFESLKGKKLSEVEGPFAQMLDGLEVDQAKLFSLGGGRRVKCSKSSFLDRGFMRHFLIMEELTDELRQSEKAAYEKLIRMMSHEVNNSVGASQSLLHSALHYRDQLSGEDSQDFQTAISIVTTRLAQLNSFMSGFADVVRLPPPRLAPCDVKHLLENVSRLMQAESSHRGVKWKLIAGEEFEPVLMDKIQMEQAFINIFKNSLEAIDEEGFINITLGKQHGRRFVVIEDTGCGIAAHHRDLLFTPFYSTKENGQGIGLTLVQEILTQHHFEFRLESAPGSVTQFTIYFD